MRRPRLLQFVRRQERHGVEINGEPDQHADAGSGEAVMPAGLFAERAANERRQERTDIDADIEDRIGAVAPPIAGRIKPTDLGRDIRLERAVAEDERGERQQEQLLDRHQEMADGHEDRADDDGAALPEHPVGKKPAENRREIDERGVEAVDLRRKGLHVERTEDRFEHVLEAGKTEHIAGVLGDQQIFRHVEDEERAHPVIREALPHLGGEQEGEAFGMAEKVGARRHHGVTGGMSAFSHEQSPPFFFPATLPIYRSRR